MTGLIKTKDGFAVTPEAAERLTQEELNEVLKLLEENNITLLDAVALSQRTRLQPRIRVEISRFLQKTPSRNPVFVLDLDTTFVTTLSNRQIVNPEFFDHYRLSRDRMTLVNFSEYEDIKYIILRDPLKKEVVDIVQRADVEDLFRELYPGYCFKDPTRE